MINVNPPPQPRLPPEFEKNKGIRTFFRHLEIIIRQLYERSGGASGEGESGSDGLDGLDTFTGVDLFGAIEDESDSLFTPQRPVREWNPVTKTQDYYSASWDYVEAKTGNIYLPKYPDIGDQVIVSSDHNNNVIINGYGNKIKVTQLNDEFRISRKGTSNTFIFFGEYWRVI